MKFLHLRVDPSECYPAFVAANLENFTKFDLVKGYKSSIDGFDSTDSDAFWVDKGSKFTPGGGKIYNSIEEWRNR